jgi:hypothetical protein
MKIILFLVITTFSFICFGQSPCDLAIERINQARAQMVKNFNSLDKYLKDNATNYSNLDRLIKSGRLKKRNYSGAGAREASKSLHNRKVVAGYKRQLAKKLDAAKTLIRECILELETESEINQNI